MESIASVFLCQVVSDAMLGELKECFLEAYDDNQDGKIEIREVRQMIAFRRKCAKMLFNSFNVCAASLAVWV